MEISYYKSPVGILEIICKNEALTSLQLVKNTKISCKESAFVKTVKTQLDEYFIGQRKIFNIKLTPEGTEFQKIVWKALREIPYGKTKSYSEIAETIGNKKAQRAVGSACNKNPVIIIIPCHRVISKNGNLGGFAYGNSVKQVLLDIEYQNNSNICS